VSPEEEALVRVVGLLRSHGIPFMLTGSVAASYHGRPRATHDADLVIDPEPDQLQTFVGALSAENFYVDSDGARDALNRRSQFNAIETRSASKIDLIIRKDRPFSHEEFRRRMSVDLGFVRDVPIVTPEDAILSKLEWACRSGESERQVSDARGILALNAAIDRPYIDRWARELGVLDLWRRLVGE
jgi:hypothetical protein